MPLFPVDSRYAVDQHANHRISLRDRRRFADAGVQRSKRTHVETDPGMKRLSGFHFLIDDSDPIPHLA
jgi:hypothetical protein